MREEDGTPPGIGSEVDRTPQTGAAHSGAASPRAGGPRLSAVDELVSKLRALISSEGLRVGDSLPTERELCDRFRASRNTVREAMGILKAYGVVTVRPKVGATIVDDRMERALELFSFNTLEVSRKTFSDIQGFRGLLEVTGIDLILARLARADIAEMREINDGLRRAQSSDEIAEIDFGFHTRLIAVMGNKAILDIYKIMKPVILRIMSKGKDSPVHATATHADHLGILDALGARDRLAYQYRMRSHLQAGLGNFDP
ncbi:FadR/GntR family transcriptional regulator [Rhodovulum sulfidophilum]|uniref:FadR family transcriptional regulator n=1 Tax=Rhodovulum sulfidophilum TaxID=35806 RepID=A0ABS1RX47_RHOSU|nr:FCD domain-containing protein [Rhodovulum sulfidophilum]MBL3610660.1 FadR family transcriptional regulator [Rhodovulum sulfidophilum]MCE8459254.1 FCD domain-containing protein [Rhodovulum sulfidophilum]